MNEMAEDEFKKMAEAKLLRDVPLPPLDLVGQLLIHFMGEL